MSDKPTKSERIAASRRAVAANHAANPGAVPRYEARQARLADVRRRDRAEGWCIVRTDGRTTLRLADELGAAGIDAWTPRRIVKRTKQGRHHLIDGKPVTVEATLPILPTFVFAPAAYVVELLGIAAQPFSPFPAFTVFRHGDRVPLVASSEIAGLRAEEAAAQVLIEKLREVEAYEERKRVRSAAMKTERERKKALRAERRQFVGGETVTISDMPALAGMQGVIEESDGRTAMVVFGDVLRMRIEAWQIVPDHVSDAPLAAE